MRYHFNLLLGLIPLLTVNVNAQGDALVEPDSVESSNGLLDIELHLEYGSFSGPFYSFTDTRLLNGTFPGPTLKLSAGDTMRILFKNNLELQDDAVTGQENEYTDPDHSNLHFHGGHVSGELPSDDIRMAVEPGDEYQYETTFPDNHLPGTHWIHPHVHGSSALQLGGGASLAMIVKDPDDFLPTQVEDATETLMLFQHIDVNTINGVISDIGDSKTVVTKTGMENPREFTTVNGQYQPTLTVQPGEWRRWRIIWGSWLGDHLNLHFEDSSNCEMQLLAKDGIYIQDYPREITVATIPTGGRADIMVRCSTSGTYSVLDFLEQTALTVEVTGSTVSSTDLEAWAPDYPDYLSDLTSTSASSGCDCETEFRRCDDKFCVNDELFDKSVYVHTVAFGSVVERELRGITAHPYHQHVYPFQLVSGADSVTDADQATYFQTGDWHDVVMMDVTSVVVRYVADVHDGVLMLHCHILPHEDEGTMSQELIIDGGSCECDARYTEPPSTSTNSPTRTFHPTPSSTFHPTQSTTPEVATNPVSALIESLLEFLNLLIEFLTSLLSGGRIRV